MKPNLFAGAMRFASLLGLSSSVSVLVAATAMAADPKLNFDYDTYGGRITYKLSENGENVVYATRRGVWLSTPDGRVELANNDVADDFYADGISDEGSVMAVTAYQADSGLFSAFIFDTEGNAIDLGSLDESDPYTSNYDLSGDGTTAVGVSWVDGEESAFRWQKGKLVELDDGGRVWSQALHVSRDGSVIAGIGSEDDYDQIGLLWRDGKLTELRGKGTSTVINGVSADGSTVIGSELTEPESSTREAFYWRDGEIQFIGTLGGQNSETTGVSADGRVIVGDSNSEMGSFDQFAYRWTKETGMVSLGAFADNYSRAYAVSADGKVVVGYSNHPTLRFTGYRWTEDKGMQTIADVMTEGGVDAAGWRFESANSVSADGATIVGEGFTPDGDPMLWIARCLTETSCIVLNDVDTGKSFAGLGAMGDTSGLYLGQTFASLGHLMDTTGAGSHAAMGGNFDSDPTAAGALSFSHQTDDGLEGALSLGIAGIETPLPFDGRSLFSAASVTASLGRDADAGFDWRLSGALAGLDGSIERGYLNGNTVERSTGETSGLGAGAEIVLGYRIADIAPATSLRPYLGANLTSTRFAGYTETGGPFPATFGAFTVTQGVVRAGIEASHQLTDAVSLDAGLAYVHRFTSAPTISGSIPGVFALSVPGETGAADWAELSLGLTLPVAEVGTLGATTMLRVPTSGTPSVVAGLSFTLPL